MQRKKIVKSIADFIKTPSDFVIFSFLDVTSAGVGVTPTGLGVASAGLGVAPRGFGVASAGVDVASRGGHVISTALGETSRGVAVNEFSAEVP